MKTGWWGCPPTLPINLIVHVACSCGYLVYKVEARHVLKDVLFLNRSALNM
jgi:hypothetical protein